MSLGWRELLAALGACTSRRHPLGHGDLLPGTLLAIARAEHRPRASRREDLPAPQAGQPPVAWRHWLPVLHQPSDVELERVPHAAFRGFARGSGGNATRNVR